MCSSYNLSLVILFLKWELWICLFDDPSICVPGCPWYAQESSPTSKLISINILPFCFLMANLHFYEVSQGYYLFHDPPLCRYRAIITSENILQGLLDQSTKCQSELLFYRCYTDIIFPLYSVFFFQVDLLQVIIIYAVLFTVQSPIYVCCCLLRFPIKVYSDK